VAFRFKQFWSEAIGSVSCYVIIYQSRHTHTHTHKSDRSNVSFVEWWPVTPHGVYYARRHLLMRLVISFADRYKLNCIYPIHTRTDAVRFYYTVVLYIIYVRSQRVYNNAQNLRYEWPATTVIWFFSSFPLRGTAVAVSSCLRLAEDDARSNDNKIETNNTYLMRVIQL